jgi:hypothetical protein
MLEICTRVYPEALSRMHPSRNARLFPPLVMLVWGAGLQPSGLLAGTLGRIISRRSMHSGQSKCNSVNRKVQLAWTTSTYSGKGCFDLDAVRPNDLADTGTVGTQNERRLRCTSRNCFDATGQGILCCPNGTGIREIAPQIRSRRAAPSMPASGIRARNCRRRICRPRPADGPCTQPRR